MEANNQPIAPQQPIVPQLPVHNLHKIYQLPRTRKTEEMMLSMLRQNKIPSVVIHDPFIYDDDINKLSHCTEDFIDEWVRTTQIMLFDQFQESLRNWTNITKDMKREIHVIKHERMKKRHLKKRKCIQINADSIDCANIQNLPDDVIRIIWSYTDDEVQNKFYLGKYCCEENLFRSMLQKLNFQTLKTLYIKTPLCYHGACMQKIIPSDRYPPISKKNKQDFIHELCLVMEDYCDMYLDPFVYTTTNKNGCIISKKDDYDIQTTKYHGMVYPASFYEKRTRKLWLHLAVAFSVFLPKDYYLIASKNNSKSKKTIKPSVSHVSLNTSITPPQLESPPKTSPPESPISFVFL